MRRKSIMIASCVFASFSVLTAVALQANAYTTTISNLGIECIRDYYNPGDVPFPNGNSCRASCANPGSYCSDHSDFNQPPTYGRWLATAYAYQTYNYKAHNPDIASVSVQILCSNGQWYGQQLVLPYSPGGTTNNNTSVYVSCPTGQTASRIETFQGVAKNGGS